jgi:hypothetical protein
MERAPCWGPLWLPVLPEGFTCPLGEAEMHHGGSDAFDDAARARARRRDVARDAYRARGLSARLGRDSVFSLCLERLTCCQCFLGPLWWAYKLAGCRILPSVGYPGYFYTRHICTDEIYNPTQEEVLEETSQSINSEAVETDPAMKCSPAIEGVETSSKWSWSPSLERGLGTLAPKKARMS